MPMANYSSGFSGGVSIRGLPVLNTHAGQVLWVNSTRGSNGNKGTRERPFSTIDYAVGRCTAGAGDVIMVMPGYTQTITGAAQIALDVAGINIIGLGNGTSMPVVEYNHADATVAVSADNITIDGINFNSSITTVGIGVDIADGVDYTTIQNCLFDVDAAATDEFTAAIHLVNDNTGTLIQNNIIHQGLGAAVAAIHMDADTAYTRIIGNYITGDYSTACIVGDTTLSTNILIDRNLLIQGIGGNIGTEPGIELLTGTTGVISNNNIVCNLATKAASIVADQCFLFENYYNEDVTGTGGIIGTASADD